MKKVKEALIIFARNPVMGKVKTRLAKGIGDEKAFEVYNKLLRLTYKNTKDLSLKKFIFYTDLPDKQIFDSSFEIKIQSEGNLGLKMSNAFREVFNSGYEKAVIIGVDCPSLKKKIILQAMELLDNYEFVFGPANDGGYYLTGMNSLHDFVFKNIKWGTKTVLQDSLAKIRKMNHSYNLLETLTDVDTEIDLLKVRELLNC